jgi:hypothetical protein
MYFDYEKEQKGYVQIQGLNKDFILANRGRKVVYLLKQNYDRHRGYMFLRTATLFDMLYSRILLDDGKNEIDRRDILEIAIERKEEQHESN